MTAALPFRNGLRKVRALDTRMARRDGRRRILVDGRTPVNFSIFAPVYEVLKTDPRIDIRFTASDEPSRMTAIYREAGPVPLIHPARAALMKFDAYVASDFMWATLPRGTCRIQMFHGVAGKYGFDAPDGPMPEWHRFFFINERRLRNFIAAGAVHPESPAIRLTGMPKTDRLVDGTLVRDEVLTALKLDPVLPTVLYAPTWSPESSLNAMGRDLVRALLHWPINLIVKLHDRSKDLRERYSGGVNWAAVLEPLFRGRNGLIATGSDVSPYLVAADLLITDHSSAGFEFLLRDRPIVRIHRPSLLELASVHPDYVRLLASASESVDTLAETVRAVGRGLADRKTRGATRRHVAADLFYRAGTATARSVMYLYDAIELEPASIASVAQEATCQPSA